MDERRNRYICAIAGRAANWPRGQSRPWKGHIVIVLDRFLILPRGRRNATRRAPKRVNGKAALEFTSNPYNAEIFLYKPWRPKVFFNLKS